ncbi:MAG TPA: sugar ABC transporter permease [Geminicoccaceae bacterium]|nr:sugar ABC transporter permease [Geminicoccus sp.]HMU48144.1 sugar ABC transporter permease [Geminicoccaceae bacterium]
MGAPRLVHWLMVAPVQLLLLACIFVPSLWVLWLSFHEYAMAQPPVFVGLANYAAILADPIFWRACLNTLIVVNLVVYGELAAGLALAMLMAGWVPMKRLVISLLLAPYAVTEVSAVVMWRYMLEPDTGMINWWLQGLGLGQIAWTVDANHALLVIVLLSIWIHLPFTFLILYAAVTTVPKELLEAARVDGANGWKAFWHITLRVIMPAVLVALLFRYIFAMRLFSEVWLLTQGGPARLTEVLAVYLYRHAFRYYEFGIAAATGWIMATLSLLIAAWYLHQLYRRMFARA